MATDFSRTLSLLRRERGISQRKAATQLGISQALLSHYENGIREPGLAFVVRACDLLSGVGGLSSGPHPQPGRGHHRGR
ncbi:MAG: helix-turn-helix domain-containing protein [Oscillospiraceae bacterium]